MDEKTIRWPGHVSQMKTLIECGLLETNPIRFDEKLIIPRKLVTKILSDHLNLGRERDLTLLRVDVSGKKDRAKVHYRYEMIDHYSARDRMTSMARTTAFPCSIAAQILGLGGVNKRGLVPPEIAFTGTLRDEFLGYLHSRGMKITSRIMR
jgi:lysine 6-dehydrogenase